MQDSHNNIIEFQGRFYRYDPEFDCFYPYVDTTISQWDRWSWLAVIVLLSIIALLVSQ